MDIMSEIIVLVFLPAVFLAVRKKLLLLQLQWRRVPHILLEGNVEQKYMPFFCSQHGVTCLVLMTLLV